MSCAHSQKKYEFIPGGGVSEGRMDKVHTYTLVRGSDVALSISCGDLEVFELVILYVCMEPRLHFTHDKTSYLYLMQPNGKLKPVQKLKRKGQDAFSNIVKIIADRSIEPSE
eukprot:2482775-Amphidinium_carterae.1